MKIYGKIVDIHKRDIYPAFIEVINGVILKIEQLPTAPDVYILPGLIDSHIHIESSMITPGAFACTAVKHGTIGVVTDPHEIANVLGIKGINFMIQDGLKVPMKFWFGASSCVPATAFETNGATLSSKEIEELLSHPEIKYLSEMMNYPGVIYNDDEVHNKLKIAHNMRKPIDGHAPGLTGEMLRKYVSAGISTDHECNTIEEAKEKLQLGMKILIREGSAARNLKALKNLLVTNPDMVMLCSDDLHPEMLRKGHINKLVGGLISEGFNVFDVIRSATINPVEHYNLEAGLLRVGDNADFILVNSLNNMDVLETWIDGKRVFYNGNTNFSYFGGEAINNFNCSQLVEDDIKVINRGLQIRIIEASEGELTTKELRHKTGNKKYVESDTKNDFLKIVVKDRYLDSPPKIGFIKGFGLKRGAFASSIAHDSHNIIAIGTNDADIINSINEIVRLKGGLAVCSGRVKESLQLNIGGIMTTHCCEEVSDNYERLNSLVKSFGCTMNAPYMTLSFMALLVIPDLKIGDQGLFDVKNFKLVSLFVDD